MTPEESETEIARVPMPWRLHALVGFIALLLAATVWYSLRTGDHMVAVHAPLVDAAGKIRLEATTAHLWFEEIISGDRKEDIASVWEHLDASEAYAQAMLEGGRRAEGVIVRLEDAHVRSDIEAVLRKIREFRKIAELRLESLDQAGVGTDIDQQFDTVFTGFLEQADKVEQHVRQQMGKELGRFRSVQALLIVACLGLAVLVGVVFHRFERRRANDLLAVLRGEETLRQSREFLQTIVDGMPEAVMVINRDHSIALANHTVREMLDGQDPVADGLTCYRVSHRRDAPCGGTEHPCPLEQVIATKTPVTVEHIHAGAADAEAFVEIVAAPVLDETGGVVQVIESARDITARKQAEKTRLDLERQVQQAQKLESLGVLAGGIAHDFNNLLMAILGNADLALQELSPHAPARQSVKEIEKASRRAAGLAKQMLAYSGKGRFVIEAIDLSEFVEEMAHLLEVSVSKRVVLKYNFAANLPVFDGDATQIRQIIMNLITNASEAIGDESGAIAISTGAMECDREYLETSNIAARAGLEDALAEGLYVYLEVADTGCGMDDETLSRIFDPFFTTKFTGRGLGMAATLGIVRGHKGAIKVYTEPGKGTTFRILFPAVERSAEEAIRKGSGKDEAPVRLSGTILLADDEQTVCALGKRMLERAGCRVLTASNGRAALETFREHKDEIACVILDLTMPKMGGEECFREMRRIKPDVIVILSSGYNEQDATQRFVGKGLAGFLQKPYRSADLIGKLKEVLQL